MTHLQACLLWHILLSSIALHGNGFRFMWFVWRSKFCIQNHIIQLVCLLQEVNFGTTQEAIDHTVLKLLLSRIVHRCFIALSSQWLMTVSRSPHSLPCVHFPSLLYGLLSASAFSQIPSPPECLTNCFWPILYFPLVMLPSIYSTCKCFALFLIIELILLFVIKVSHRLSNTNTLSLHEHLNHPWLYMICWRLFYLLASQSFSSPLHYNGQGKVHPQISQEIPVPPGSIPAPLSTLLSHVLCPSNAFCLFNWLSISFQAASHSQPAAPLPSSQVPPCCFLPEDLAYSFPSFHNWRGGSVPRRP